MPRGGYRPGSGRKPKQVTESLKRKMEYSNDDIVKAICERAKAGEPWACRLFMTYYYGVPPTYTPEVDDVETEQPQDIRSLRVELNSNKAVNE